MTAHDWRAALLRLDGAYADNTTRTYRTDVQAYENWALREGVESFLASAGMIAAFIEARAPHDAASTLRRRINGLRNIHRLLKMPYLVDDEQVTIALRKALSQKRSRMKQDLGLKRGLLERLMAATGDDLLGMRNRALLALGYATLCRRSELVAIRVEDFGKVDEDGSVSVLVRRSEADSFGFGRVAWVSPDAMEHVRVWLYAAGIGEDYVLRAVFG